LTDDYGIWDITIQAAQGKQDLTVAICFFVFFIIPLSTMVVQTAGQTENKESKKTPRRRGSTLGRENKESRPI
jgi:hypothetical protein